MEYYCHACAEQLNLIPQIDVANSLATTYQLGKFMKHIIPSTMYRLNSVFIDSSTEKYGNYLVDAQNSGSVQIDDKRRKNIILFAGKQTGIQYINGRYDLPTDAITVVLSSDPQKTHLFPISSTTFSTGVCHSCQRSILT
jgi:hypothetical protein